jgi:hypothetical protein
MYVRAANVKADTASVASDVWRMRDVYALGRWAEPLEAVTKIARARGSTTDDNFD